MAHSYHALPCGVARVVVAGRPADRRAPHGWIIGIPRALAIVMAKRSTQLLNALDLLTEQHNEIDELLEQLKADGDDSQAAFVELADKLAAHTIIEEKLFYPRVMSDQTSDLLHQSVEEHLAMKRVLADLVTMELDTDQFKAKLLVLAEEVSHHAHEVEEAKLFPLLRMSMDPDELAGLGNDLLVMFEDLIASEPRLEVPKETAEAAPLLG